MNFYVEFKIDNKTSWVKTQEITLDDAKKIKKKFHDAGIKARVFSIATVKTILI